MESMWQTSQDLEVYLTQEITQIICCYWGVCVLYGCEAWTITPRLSKDLYGCYTRLLRTPFNVHWKQHKTNQQWYGDLPEITDKIRERRLRFARHWCRSSEETVQRLLLWNPKHGKENTRHLYRPTQTRHRTQGIRNEDSYDGQKCVVGHHSSGAGPDLSKQAIIGLHASLQMIT